MQVKIAASDKLFILICSVWPVCHGRALSLQSHFRAEQLEIYLKKNDIGGTFHKHSLRTILQ